MTVLLTGLFLWPLLRRGLLTAELRQLARRTLLTSAITLFATVVRVITPTSFRLKTAHLFAGKYRNSLRS